MWFFFISQTRHSRTWEPNAGLIKGVMVGRTGHPSLAAPEKACMMVTFGDDNNSRVLAQTVLSHSWCVHHDPRDSQSKLVLIDGGRGWPQD